MNRLQEVAYCGLWCAGCGAFKKGKCSGCKEEGGLKSCPVRICSKERNYLTCAQCESYTICKKLNNFILKMFSLVFKSNRMDNLTKIKEKGIEVFIAEREMVGKI